MTQIDSALSRLFKKHRIIFWYDANRELRAEFDAVALGGVEKVVIDNNQFGLKYRLLRGEPQRQFLLYHAGPPPEGTANWLLDVQLAHGEFRADQLSLWLGELGLGLEFAAQMADHAEFLRSGKRRAALQRLIRGDDTMRAVRRKMMAVCAGSDPNLDAIVTGLLGELAEEKDGRWSLLVESGLAPFFWDELARHYGYEAENPGLEDFYLTLFKQAYAQELGGAQTLTNDALVFLRNWRDNVRHQDAFDALSNKAAEVLAIRQDLEGRSPAALLECDYFELIDQKLLSSLARAVAERTLLPVDVRRQVRRRRQSHWFEKYRHAYEALDQAAQLLDGIDKATLQMGSLAEGVDRYARLWQTIDQQYRRVVYHARQAGHSSLLKEVLAEVEKRYGNQFLLPLNDAWQVHVDAADSWRATGVQQQADFFALEVAPVLQSKKKLFVIISDALRYEVAAELLQRIRQEDRYDAELRPMLGVLPSYTQLGMAALLPHQQLAIDQDAGRVLVDGQSSVGADNRRKILQAGVAGSAAVLKAEELLQMNRDESRALFRENDVVYVYHNRIDAVGDKRDSEERVFEAVEEALEELLRLIKKSAGANATNMIVTADHGFIYQHQALEESDFMGDTPQGAEILLHNRRFVLGRGLLASSGFRHFAAARAGLAGEMEILVPKSINRLRKQGAGSRYVHGGAALQEVVVPLLRINKGRSTDTEPVEVDILQSGRGLITTGQFTVTFYQREPVSDKILPRTLRAGVYTRENVLISNQEEVTFDVRSAETRDREISRRFILTSEAGQANNQEVILRLEEQQGSTTHYKTVREARYTLRRSFTSDFDF